MTSFRRKPQEGQILVLAALLMTFFFIPLAIFVVDTGLVEAGYAQLNETVQAAAEDGASMLNEDLYRSNRMVELDAARAREVSDRALSISSLPGLGPWGIDVQGTRVTVTARLRLRLFVLGTTTLTTTKSAQLAYGQ